MAKNIITIPSKITKGEELVIISRSLYEKIKREREEKIKEKLFKENPFHLSLETHKLKGKYKNFYSYFVTRGYRVLLCFINRNESNFLRHWNS